MAPLKLLEHEYPILDSDFQNFCASHGIFSVEDILLHDIDTLVALMEQNSSAVKLKLVTQSQPLIHKKLSLPNQQSRIQSWQLIFQKSTVFGEQGMTEIITIIGNMHQPWLNGIELLEDSQRNKHVLSSGCESIDVLLQGGLHEGHLTEIVGPSSSGKTQACLQIASSVAKNYSGNVVYFDTGNSFSPKRVAQIISQTSDLAIEEINKLVERVMKNMLCHGVFDIFTLFDLLNQVKSDLKSQENCKTRLLIIDSISSLITPILGGTQGHALMISVGFLLKELAHEHNVAILVTNHMVGGDGGNIKPALGESWKSVPHVQLRVSRDQNTKNILNISIFKHPFMVSSHEVKFRML